MIRTLIISTALLITTPVWAQEAVPQTPAKPFVYTAKTSDVVMGKEKASVVVVEYASLSCPHCAHFFNDVFPEINTKYIETGKIRLVYRDFPLNDPALKAAELIQCADKDRRHTFLKVLFSTQSKWAYDANYKESLASIAALGGMDRSKFDGCMADKALEKSVGDVAKEAQDDFKVSSTPTFYINGKILQGAASAEAMSQAIDEALATSAKK